MILYDMYIPKMITKNAAVSGIPTAIIEHTDANRMEKMMVRGVQNSLADMRNIIP